MSNNKDDNFENNSIYNIKENESITFNNNGNTKLTFSPEKILSSDSTKNLQVDKIFSYDYSFNNSILKIELKKEEKFWFDTPHFFKKINKKICNFEISKKNKNYYFYKIKR